jgi:amino acid exporter
MDEISPYLPGIGLAYSAFLLSIMSPGPNVLAIMGTSMSVGRPQGVALGLGVAAGSFCWAMLTATGLSAILARFAVALTAIKIVGGLYILWLAYKAFRSAASAHDMATTTPANAPFSSSGYFRRGFAVQMTNPKAVLAWIAIISLGLKADAPYWVAAVIIIGTTVFSVIIHMLYALAFSSTPMLRLYSKARRLIQAVLGAFFAFAGIKLLTTRLQ